MQLGIDFGTCSTCAVIRDGRRRIVVKDPITDASSIPTSIYVEKNGTVLIGSAAESKRLFQPASYRGGLKSDLNRTDRVEHGRRNFSGIELVAEVLRAVKELVHQTLVDDRAVFESVVLTVPAHYNSQDLERMRQAGILAGFDGDRIKLIEEPVGAAISYIQNEQGLADGETLLVYDLGGGTFDAAIVKKTEAGFVTVGSSGLPDCAGERFDQVIASDIAKAGGTDIDALLSSYPDELSRLTAGSQLEDLSVKVKLDLSELIETSAHVALSGREVFEYTLTREAFNAMIAPVIRDTITCCQELIARSGLSGGKDDLAGVLLVGGSSRVPAVAEAIAKAFGRPLFTVDDPKLVVALGAACLGEFAMSECRFCAGTLPDALPFCPYCRTIRRDISAMTPAAAEEYRRRLKSLSLALRHPPKAAAAILWDYTVNRYAVNLRDARAFISSLDTPGEAKHDGSVFEDSYQAIEAFMHQCRDPDFHIAFVGTIKAGKSTLINAVFDRQLASTSVTPETAALTLFRKSRLDSIKVIYYTAEEWDKLWLTVPKDKNTDFLRDYNSLNAEAVRSKYVGAPERTLTFADGEQLREEIKTWTSCKQPEHYFVKRVEVGLSDFPLSEQIVLVDTPGLDDPIEYRSNVTKDYIHRANAVFVCVSAAGALTGPQIRMINGVFDNTPTDRSKVYLVGTQLDKCNDPVSDWSAIKDEWMKHVAEASGYGSRQLAEQNIVGVAAYFYSIVSAMRRGEKISSTERKVLNAGCGKFIDDLQPADVNNHFDTLIALTNVDTLRERIINELVERYKTLVLKDVFQAYTRVSTKIKNSLLALENNQASVLHSFDQSIEQIRDEIQQREAEKTRIKDTTAVLEEVKRALRERASEQETILREKLNAMNV